MNFMTFIKVLKNPGRVARFFKKELQYPKTWYTKMIAELLIFFRKFRSDKAYNKEALLFCYDLAINPITFDFVEFMVQAELKRRKLKLMCIDVLIIFNKQGSIIPEDDYSSHVITYEQRLFRIFEMLINGCRLLPSVRNVSFVTRNTSLRYMPLYEHKFPESYHSLKPLPCDFTLPESPEIFYPMIQPQPDALRLVKEYFSRFRNKKIVTITLREYDYLPERNSNIEAWVEFARSLTSNYQVVFVPDASSFQSKFRDRIKGFEIFDAACWNLSIRTALYASSWMNLGTVGGPLIVSLYLENANTIYFWDHTIYPPEYLNHLKRFYKDEIGQKRRYLRFNNHYVYKKDSFENIRDEFYKLEEQLVEITN